MIVRFRSFLSVLLATVSLLVSSAAAWALDANSDTWLNVRIGPGSDHAVLATLYPGERVTIVECENSDWCLITRPSLEGWVRSDHLSPVVDEEPVDPESSASTNPCNCVGYSGPGGACYAGPGGPAYAGPGGPAYRGPGGPCYAGPGGPAYPGPGGPCYAGPGGPCYAGPGSGSNCPSICRR
jgi:uncharacterized protein YraI